MDLLNSAHLQKCECVKRLGEGACANVFLYMCKGKCNGYTRCNQLFVVKRMHFKYANIQDEEKFLEFEYKIGHNLDHPNIIKTLDIDIHNRCIIFEYFPCIDLFDYISETIYIDDFHIMSQLLNAVEYLHNLGISHSDIKPENILVNFKTSDIKLIDFGHARYFKINNDPVTYKGVWGTPEYIPPEAYTIEYDPSKVDVWSCGLILYILLYNKQPWEIANLSDTNFKVNQRYLKNNSLHPSFFYMKEYNDIFKMVFSLNQRCTIHEFREKFILLY
jgi:serine/threonine protein kinase